MKNNDDKTSELPYSNTGVFYTEFPPSTPLSIDWLSVSCKANKERSQVPLFTTLKYSTRNFKKVEIVSYDNVPYCTMISEPASAIIPPDSVILKFENWLLYQPNFALLIDKIISDCGLTYKQINRLDLAIDFVHFANRYKPENLIKDFASGNIHHSGKAKFKIIGTTAVDNIFDYFRIGTGNSLISIYLYNKSKELREVKDKLHIRELWKDNGLDTGPDIWRLEVSLKSDTVKVLDMESGEIHPIDLVTVKDSVALSRLFRAAINGRFLFKRKSKDSNKSRWPVIQLFKDWSKIEHKTITTKYTTDVTKMHKVALKKYVDFFKEVNISDPFKRADFIEHIETYAHHYNLTKYLQEKTDFKHVLNTLNEYV